MPQCRRVPGGPVPPPQTCPEPGRDPAPTGRRHGAGCWGAASPWAVTGEAGRWAGAGAGQQLLPPSHTAPVLRHPLSPLPRAGHLPVCCPDRHSQLKQMHVPNQALLGPYWFRSAPQGSSPEPHCSACCTAASVLEASAACGSSPLPAGRPPRHGRDCPQRCPRQSSGSVLV